MPPLFTAVRGRRKEPTEIRSKASNSAKCAHRVRLSRRAEGRPDGGQGVACSRNCSPSVAPSSGWCCWPPAALPAEEGPNRRRSAGGRTRSRRTSTPATVEPVTPGPDSGTAKAAADIPGERGARWGCGRLPAEKHRGHEAKPSGGTLTLSPPSSADTEAHLPGEDEHLVRWPSGEPDRARAPKPTSGTPGTVGLGRSAARTRHPDRCREGARGDGRRALRRGGTPPGQAIVASGDHVDGK